MGWQPTSCSANGRSLSWRLQRYGYSRYRCTVWRVGEVLARGRFLYATPEVIVMRWMRSKTHRALLLKKSWRDIGVGRRKGTFKGKTKTILTTVDFGRRVRK